MAVRCRSVIWLTSSEPALLSSLGYSRRDGWLQSPCDLAGEADNVHQVNLGPPGDG